MGSKPSENHAALSTTSALRLSIATGFFLMLVKIATGVLTHSMAVMASALDSGMDVAVSSVNYLAARKSSEPPDAEHTYGHGKIESLAGLFQSLLISASGLYLVWESFSRMVRGSYISNLGAGAGVMVLSIAVTSLLVWRLKASAKKSGSIILQTESLHFTTDLAANAGVICAFGLIRLTGYVFWDLLVSIVIAATILRSAYSIFQHSIDELLDRSLPPSEQRLIKRMILSHHKSVTGIHNFRNRRVGRRIFLDFHIDIQGEDDFKHAHFMTESLVAKIQKRYPDADVTVHYDPEGEDERIKHAHFAGRG
ncbi:MAG: cation diffusion facilitator family transporter [Candidatus Omnitrophota bacterium]|jgi:cation diffusion facilitator family transporter